MHEWITDNQQTPHIVVDSTMADVAVPRQNVQNGKIILNVSHSATNGLALGNDSVRFRARFGATTYDVSVPVLAIMGIYARETGQGMIFSESDGPTPPAAPEPPAPSNGTSETPKRSHLKVVK